MFALGILSRSSTEGGCAYVMEGWSGECLTGVEGVPWVSRWPQEVLMMERSLGRSRESLWGLAREEVSGLSLTLSVVWGLFDTGVNTVSSPTDKWEPHLPGRASGRNGGESPFLVGLQGPQVVVV